MRIPASGGPAQSVMETQGWEFHACATRPGGPCVVAEQTPDRKQFVFTAFDPVKGRGQEVAKTDTEPLGYNLSPDGSRLAVITDNERGNQIRIFTLPSGAEHDLTVEGWSGLRSLGWLADGKGMTVSSVSAQGCTLLSVDLEGHAQPLWEQRASPWCYANASRDGRYLAISAAAVNSNIWMVEDF